MKTNKTIGYGILAVMITLAFAALSLTGCEQPTDTPTVTLSGITAAYNQTAAVYPDTPRDALKAGLTVTAKYSDNTSKTVDAADYALSGTLAAPASAVTVSYTEGAVTKTADFTVTVTAGQGNPADITYSVARADGADGTADTTGITFSASVDDLNLSAADIAIGGTASKGSATFAKSGGNWLLSPITVNTAGQATVSISKDGIETGTKNLTVYKAGQTVSKLFYNNR